MKIRSSFIQIRMAKSSEKNNIKFCRKIKGLDGTFIEYIKYTQSIVIKGGILMAITINTQENPKVSQVGKSDANATIIYSGLSNGVITYDIASMDGQNRFRVCTSTDISRMANVLFVSRQRLKVVLPNRKWYKVRVKSNEKPWSDWTEFKTRDKTYATPVAIYTSRGDEHRTDPTIKGSKTITITEVGKTTRTSDIRFVNSDFGYVGTTNIQTTAHGIIVTTDDFDAQTAS